MTLRIEKLSRNLVARMPDRSLDLIEIAALVYAADSAVSRGGTMDQHMGAKWHRRFRIEMPVRELALWQDPVIKRALEETLMFLSGDRFEFEFTEHAFGNIEQTGFFDFGPDDSWVPDTVMMFSGGLDSFAGALEEIVERKNRVALISHFSSTKIAPVQRALQKAITNKLDVDKSRHFPMRVELKAGSNTEGTHRTRSFLFASLGVVTAQAFGKERVSFYENGVVSLNLPPVGNVLGTRASRTTHPQSLNRFSDLFGQIFEAPIRIDNPFFWRTKTDVVTTIARLGMADQIAHTRSCADVHNQTKQFAHCGRCSQCIDRRFAVLAAKLEQYDPEEAYRVDLIAGRRSSVRDKEIALSYVRMALGFEVMTPVELERRFSEIVNAVDHLGEPPVTALSRLTDLLRRHGAAVSEVMREAMKGSAPDQFPEDSLPYLFGDLESGQAFAHEGLETAETSPAQAPESAKLLFDRKRKTLLINDSIEIKGATFQLLLILANAHLGAAGEGRDLLDYPFMAAGKLCDLTDLGSEEALRRRVMRARSILAKRFESTGLDPETGRNLIETQPWQGYRLTPEKVEVRMIDSD